MNTNRFIEQSIDESIQTKRLIREKLTLDIETAIDTVVASFKNGNKLLICGNGGSAADSQHIAAEFMIRLSHTIQRPALPAIALTTDSSNLTAGGNDIGFDNVFARNVEGLGARGDVLLAISTSGNSKNVVKAVEKAREKGMIAIGFLGGSGGVLKDVVDIPLIVPSNNVQRIQEGHILLAHILCESVEIIMYGNS